MIPAMAEHGGETDSVGQTRRSRLYDYVDASEPRRQRPPRKARAQGASRRRYRVSSDVRGIVPDGVAVDADGGTGDVR